MRRRYLGGGVNPIRSPMAFISKGYPMGSSIQRMNGIRTGDMIQME